MDTSQNFDPNSYPEQDYELEIDSDELPKFVHCIFRDFSITYEAKVSFVKKFLITYLTDDEFRQKVDGWIFMFVKGEYIGVFKNEDMAMKHVSNNAKPSFVHMYILTYGKHPQL
jgi:hypothetical protein